jgi:nitroimidazol reductase NimA-like FMN-containing flavoprotein (pyridoxamine 5'-phosphate oxidase superfamily)
MHAWSLLEKHLNWWEMGSLKPEEAPPVHESKHLFYAIYMSDLSGRAATRAD